MKKASYLGQLMEYTLDTPIGALFAISTAVERPLAVGAHVGVALANHGVVVIPDVTRVGIRDVVRTFVIAV